MATVSSIEAMQNSHQRAERTFKANIYSEDGADLRDSGDFTITELDGLRRNTERQICVVVDAPQIDKDGLTEISLWNGDIENIGYRYSYCQSPADGLLGTVEIWASLQDLQSEIAAEAAQVAENLATKDTNILSSEDLEKVRIYQANKQAIADTAAVLIAAFADIGVA